MEIVYTNGTDERFNNLCKELDQLLEDRMGEEKQNKCGCSNNICGKTNVALLLEDGRPIACGAIRRYSKRCAEIKRVYVKSEFRKKGYGKLIVSILEKIARRENYHFTLLEIGDKLYEAHSMYKNMGYKVIPNYAEYRCMKDSICMKKNIVPKSIETERLILRHIKSSDAEDIFEYSKNPDVGPNAGWEPHKSVEDSKEIMKYIFLGENNIFGIELKENKKLIGTIGLIKDLKRENPTALMLGYALSKDYWGKGIMSEAAKTVIDYGFNELGLDIISCCCYSFNKRSRRVIEKSGFRYEGTIRGAEMRYDGKIFDLDSFSLIKDEWKKMK